RPRRHDADPAEALLQRTWSRQALARRGERQEVARQTREREEARLGQGKGPPAAGAGIEGTLSVIASEAKQSSFWDKKWIASSQKLLAMTTNGELHDEPEKPVRSRLDEDSTTDRRRRGSASRGNDGPADQPGCHRRYVGEAVGTPRAHRGVRLSPNRRTRQDFAGR